MYCTFLDHLLCQAQKQTKIRFLQFYIFQNSIDKYKKGYYTENVEM